MSTRKITKLNVYLNEEQYHKIVVLASQKCIDPEQEVNEIVYNYLSIVDLYAKDYEDMTAEEQAEYDRRLSEECGDLL